MGITTLEVIFSAPMPKSSGGLVVRAPRFNPWLGLRLFLYSCLLLILIAFSSVSWRFTYPDSL